MKCNYRNPIQRVYTTAEVWHVGRNLTTTYRQQLLTSSPQTQLPFPNENDFFLSTTSYERFQPYNSDELPATNCCSQLATHLKFWISSPQRQRHCNVGYTLRNNCWNYCYLLWNLTVFYSGVSLLKLTVKYFHTPVYYSNFNGNFKWLCITV
jgi:hypothetical protein